MRPYLVSLFAAGLAAGAGSAAFAVTLPTANITVGGTSFPASGLFVSNSSGYSLPSTTRAFPDGSTVTFSAASNTNNGTLSYSFSITNPNGPQSYDFNVEVPLTTLPTGTAYSSSLSGSGTDNSGNGGSITPTTGTTAQQAFSNGASLGIDLGPAYTLDPTSPSYTPFFQFGNYAGGSAAAGQLTSLGLHLGVTVPGGGDVFSFTGRIGKGALSVPEPGALALLTGTGAFGVLLRRRHAIK